MVPRVLRPWGGAAGAEAPLREAFCGARPASGPLRDRWALWHPAGTPRAGAPDVVRSLDYRPAPWLARPPGPRAAPAGRLALSLALAAAVSLALRLPFLSVPLITDEAGYAYVAYWLARGQALYRDLWFDRPQGIFLIYGAILRLFGESTEAIRLAAGLYNAGTTVLLGLLGARLFGPLAGAAAAGVFAVASASPVIEGFTANGEVFMNLPVVLCVLLAVQRRPFLAGVALALATAIKPTALPAAGPALLVALWNPLAGGPARPARLSARARAALAGRPGFEPPPPRTFPVPGPRRPGAALGFAPFLLHGLATDPTGYWYAVVGFRVQAHSAFSVGLPFVGELGQTAPTVLAALLPVWLLACAALWGGAWQTPGREGGPGLPAGRPGRRRRRGLLVLALLRRSGAPRGPPRRRRTGPPPRPAPTAPPVAGLTPATPSARGRLCPLAWAPRSWWPLALQRPPGRRQPGGVLAL